MRAVRNALTVVGVVTIVAGLTVTAAPAQAATAGVGTSCAPGTLSVQALASGCTTTSGTVVTPDGRTFAIPAPGESVMASSSSAPGARELPDVVVANNGSAGVAVRVDEEWSGSAPAVEQERAEHSAPATSGAAASAASSAAAAAPAATTAASTKCTSAAWEPTGYRWASTVKWYYNESGQKSTYAKKALRKGANAWTGTISACDRTVTSTASNTYLRLATQKPNLTDQGGCSRNNGYNVMGWGKLPSGVLGVTCVWFDGNGTAREADQRYATGFRWSSTETCSGSRFDTQVVATHEWGHLYGLDHVQTGTGQVMEPSGGYCQLSSRTLGRGDMTGIDSLY
ncbi:matrixin family metalloprotease [Curtobacterium sp. YC1]|uniref:matrixin family metalloprotease n=1 Tax=Curtobacterium sp. YC1 TaxID=2795488 RepID=UPI0018E5405A|nr:matrixin family metalloprotease [Curtobacterium sp. YC1]QQD76154.1 matrixin family metalloprotease [Curtobacterium sp. YC1]